VTIHYPFHPYHGLELPVVHRPRSHDAPVTVLDPAGTHLKVPSWMCAPHASRFRLSRAATITPEALQELEELLHGPLAKLSVHP
jgi:hypothetical protein